MPSPASASDLVLRDARRAGAVFLVAALFLLLGAAIGLNTWPGQSFWRTVQDTEVRELLHSFQTFSVVFVVLFWGSAPRRALKVAVIAGWVAVSGLFAWGVADARVLIWPNPAPGPVLLFFLATLAVSSLLATLWRVLRPAHDDAALNARLRWLALLTLLFIFVPQPLLSLTATLHPQTFDLHALHFDRSVALDITPALRAFVDAVPTLADCVIFAYGVTPLVFLAVPLRQLHGKPQHVASALLMWVVMTVAATLSYQVLPITGPTYVFGAEQFVAALQDAAQLPVQVLDVKPYPRNGMPSMHFGWLFAASIMWWQMGTRVWTRAVMIVMTALTAMATLYLGEHYTVDLVVAVPFVLASLAMSSTGVPWSSAAKRRVVTLGFGCWLVWMMVLRTQIDVVIAQPVWGILMLVATLAVVVSQAHAMRQFVYDAAARRDERDALGLESAAAAAPAQGAATAAAAPPAITDESVQHVSRLARRFGVMFFVSGAAALVYQVLFAKQLALVFGSTATATFTVLTTFLGGMALGSVIGGRWAQRSRRPLVAYAFIELGIAAYCALTPQLFKAVQALYVMLASGSAPDAAGLLVLRVLLGSAVLLVPTALMGITLPMLVRALGPQSGRVGSRVAWLYFANTAGAALGALLAAYWVIPSLGAYRTTLVAAMLNLLVALAALEIAKRAPELSREEEDSSTEVAIGPTPRPALRALALFTLGLGGLIALGLEVVYVHMLSIVAGNSVYAFGLMVATFLCGLSIGGEGARRLLARPAGDAPYALMVTLLGLSAAVTLGAWAWNMIPAYFATYAGYPLARSFGAREAIRGLVCALVMIPPTVFIGAAYVLGMDMLTSASRRAKVRALGAGAAINTAGNIVGVLLFGFVLLPWLGGLDASRVIASAAWLLGLAVALVAVRGRLRAAGAALAASLALLFHGGTMRLDYEMLSSGANIYFAPQRWGPVVDRAESIDGGLTTVTRSDDPPPSVHTLLTNGKFQGNDAESGEMQAQIGFALAPLLHQPARDRALVIGYGTGATARVFHEAGFRHVDIAELSGDIVRLANRYFGMVNAQVTEQPGVQLHVTDGRNLLLLSERQYDVVSIEISSIWFAGAASLYNKEFYELVRKRLAPGGVLQQWVQLHRLTPLDIVTIIGSVRSEFRHVSVYMIGSQGIIVATNDPARAAPSEQAIALLEQGSGLANVRRIAERGIRDLPRDMLVGPDGADRLLASLGGDPSLWWSTDDNLRLEYSTPKANVNDGEKTIRVNRELLLQHRH